MSKELDYLDKILNYQPLTLVERTIIECIKEKIHRLEVIKNANPSEALDILLKARQVCDVSCIEMCDNCQKKSAYNSIKQALLELKSIKEANPSEALKLAEWLECDLQATNDLVTRTINGYDYLDILETIKQALLKAEKEHNSVNLLMQELDCKDFAELRKCARCGYEKINKKDLHLERVEE